MVKKLYFACAFVAICMISAIVYLNIKTNSFAKEIEDRIRLGEKEIEQNLPNFDTEIKDLKCEKIGWLLPEIKCQMQDVSFWTNFASQKKKNLSLSIQNLSVLFSPTLKTLFGKELVLSYSGNIKYHKEGLGWFLQSREEREVFNALFEALVLWLPQKFDFQEKFSLKDNTFFITSNGSITTGILDGNYQLQTQAQQNDGKKISLDVFLKKYFSLDLDDGLRFALTSAIFESKQNANTEKNLSKSFGDIQRIFGSPFVISSEFISDFVAQNLDMLLQEALGLQIQNISHYKEFIQHAKDILLVLANKKTSATLTLKLKEGVLPFKSEAMQKFHTALLNLDNEKLDMEFQFQSILDAFSNVLKEYNITPTSQNRK